MNEVKNINFDSVEKMLSGIEQLALTVGSTLGPKGRTVVIENKALPYPIVTKDGVTVAKHIEVEDSVENLGVNIVKQAAAQTVSTAGDGTTTATLLSYALIKELLPLTKQFSPIQVVRKLSELKERTLKYLEDTSTEMTMEDIKKIATIAANNDETVGQMIYDSYQEIGLDGMITVEETKDIKTVVKIAEGATFNKGWVSRYFVNAPNNECILENPYILITDKKLSNIQELVPVIEKVMKTGRQLLLVAETEGMVTNALVTNAAAGNFKSCIIYPPSFGDMRADSLTDLAILTNGTVISENEKHIVWKDVSLDELGQAERVIVRREETVIVSKPDEEKVAERVKKIDELLPDNEHDSYVYEQLLERRARLCAKVARIFVGAPTETELREKKDRLDDALRATRSSMVKGYLPGGGTSLAVRNHSTSEGTTPESDPIVDAYHRALQYPTRFIAKNAGYSPDIVIDRLNSKGLEFNALTGEFTKLKKEGIIDPTYVVMQALINGVSAASMILLSSATVTNVNKEPSYAPPSLDDFANQP